MTQFNEDKENRGHPKINKTFKTTYPKDSISFNELKTHKKNKFQSRQ
jgi:hypothetical protein